MTIKSERAKDNAAQKCRLKAMYGLNEASARISRRWFIDPLWFLQQREFLFEHSAL